MSDPLRLHANAIWHAAVAAARPEPLVRRALADLADVLRKAPRILVLGAGKAGAAMAEAVENALADRLDRIEGIVNVPADALTPGPLPRWGAGTIAENSPERSPTGGDQFPDRRRRRRRRRKCYGWRKRGPDDVALCLLSGGGSALLPAPAEAFPWPTSSPSLGCCTTAARPSTK